MCFYDNFVKLCNQKGVSRTKACVDFGISRTAWHKWERGTIPNGSTLNKMSEYFDVQVSELLGEQEQKENPTTQMGSEVDEVTMELLDIIQNGTDEDRQDLLEMYRLLKRREKR